MGRKDKVVPFEGSEVSPLGARLRDARHQKDISLTQMAKDLRYTKSHLSAVETGNGHPSLKLIESYEQRLGLRPGELTHGDGNQWVAQGQHTPSYKDTGEVRQEKGTRVAQGRKRALVEGYEPTQAAHIITDSGRIEDWGEAPTTRNFYGRKQELAELRQWVVDERCRLVVLLGMGGVGKTALANAAVRQFWQIEGEFSAIIWRSLRDTPLVEDILRDCIRLFSGQRHIDLPAQADTQIELLIKYLQHHRCLVVLDNFEPVLQSGSPVGQYQEGYEGYGKLIECIGKTQHQSCLLVTSREKPQEIAHLEVTAMAVRSLLLSGVGEEDGQNILKDNGLVGSDAALTELSKLYSGNPLALKLVAASIRDIFAHDVDAFLDAFRSEKDGEEVIIVGDISDLLDQQFQRLSEQERDIMYWLAIGREPVSVNDLKDDSIRPVSMGALFQIIQALQHRSLIETKEHGRFTLQPVIMEYITESFVNRVYAEIATEKRKLLASHLLIKAQARDYVRSLQTRFILAPLAHRLRATFGKEESERKLENMLSQLRETHLQSTEEYTAGNILNLLVHLGCDLRSYDFSRLVVWQAYLQGVALPEINFAYAELGRSVFTDTFERVLIARLSPDGTHLAAGTGNGNVRIWDASGDTPLYICRGHTDWVRSIAFSRDGKTLVSGSDDQTIRLWDVETGQWLQTLQGFRSRVYAVAFHRDGHHIASGHQDGTVRVWDLHTEQCQVFTGHAKQVWSVAFSPNGSLLASGSGDTTIRLWDSRTGQLLRTLEKHTRRIRSIAFSSDGTLLASGSKDLTVRIWNVKTGQPLRTLEGHAGEVRSLDFGSKSRLLVSGSDDRSVRVWDIKTGRCSKTIEGHTNWVRSVAFSPDEKTIISSSEDQTVRLWDVNTGHCLKTLQGYTNWVYAIAFSPDGKVLASSSGDLMVRLWDVSTGEDFKALQGHTNWVRSIAFSPDRQLLASGGEDRTICLWDASKGQCLWELQGHTSWVYAVAFSPTGKVLASGSEDRTICLWDTHTGQLLQRLPESHTDWVRSIAFSPDGLLLASGGEDRTVRLWDVKTGQLIETLKGHSGRVYAVVFSPDGKTVASSSEDGVVKLWDVATKHCYTTLQGHTGRVWSTAFSPDGKTIASGSEDCTVRLWAASTGECLKTLEGFTNRVYSTTFSPDGSTVAGASHDGTVKLWTVQTGELVRTLRKKKPYEGMNITGVQGLTMVQKDMLKALGAVEQ